MKNIQTVCLHLSIYNRELKSFPRDTIIVTPSNPDVIVSCECLELIGKNLEQIIENIEISNDCNHYNRLYCKQTAFDSSAPIIGCWKYQYRLFWMEFYIRSVYKWDSTSPYCVSYELTKLGEIIGTTQAILNMAGIEGITYKELIQYMTDYKDDFIVLKSVQ